MSGRSTEQRRTYCAFLDVRSAFDSRCVWREGLCVKLFDSGIRGKALAYLRYCPLMSSRRTVRVGDAPTDEDTAWEDSRGVAQGVTGAPFAYSIMAADLIKAVRLPGCGIRLRDGTRVHSISYADDIVLIAETPAALQQMLDAAYQHSRRDRFDFEPSKCEVVVYGSKKDAGAADESVFYLNSDKLKKSNVFRYLGAPIEQVVRANALRMPAARRKELLDKVYGGGRRLNILRVSAADPVMTPLDTRMIFLGTIAGLNHYASASEVRGLSRMLDTLQVDAGRVIMRLPSRKKGRIADDAIWGDLGLQDASAAAVKDALRLFSRVRAIPQHHQLARVYRHYEQVAAERGYPAGNWVSWLRECLGYVGHPEYEEQGWPEVGADGKQAPSTTEEVDRWQQHLWLGRVSTNGWLVPQYPRLCSHRELAEYMREGTPESRRAMLRFRCGMIPAGITAGRYATPQVPWHLRHCVRCGAAECDDTEHVLLRCAAYAEQRRALVRAVSECMPRDVVAWAGSLEDNPQGWLALLLDGELEGVPMAEIYGRSLKAIRGFKGFWRRGREEFRRECYAIVHRRQRLRAAVRPELVSIMRDLERRAGIVRAPRRG